MLKISLLLTLITLWFGTGYSEPTGIQCYTCEASDGESCEQNLVRCPSVFQACQSIVSSDGAVKKRCRNIIDCWREAQKGCQDGKCWSCCDEDSCNSQQPTYTAARGELEAEAETAVETENKPAVKEVQATHVCDPNPCRNGGTCEEIEGGDSCGSKSSKSCKSDSKKSDSKKSGTKSSSKSKKAKKREKGGTANRRKKLRNELAQLKGKAGIQKSSTKSSSSGGDEYDDFVCHCPNGYHGRYCEEYGGPNPCDSHPCQNGGTCHQDGDGYWCECPSGFDGYRCETANNPCSSHPCFYGGTCHSDGGDYWCECPSGYEGRQCETGTNPCSSHPCHNGGTCHRDGGGYWCECPNEYQGQRCETPPSGPCQSNPCNNGGTCHHDGGGYWCECPSGYNGHNCETAPNACGSHPCYNGGTCHNEGGGYWCECPNGYVGYRCETASNPCNPNPCYYGGTCHPDGGGYWCECHPGYEGQVCETARSPCDSHPCHNGGTCHQDGGYYWCECEEEYEGRQCENGDNPCYPNPCSNGGTCEVDSESSSRTRHLDLGSGTSRMNADTWIPIGLILIGLKRLHSRRDDHLTCHCPDGYYGKYCDSDRNPCEPNPCANGGTCNVDSRRIFGKRGRAKTQRRLLAEANSASFSSIGSISLSRRDDDYFCTCPEGFHGQDCEYVTTPCSSYPCENGGTCNHDGGNYWCICEPAYEGQNCEIKKNPCDPNPCQNGGSCDEDRGPHGLVEDPEKRETSLISWSRWGDYFKCECPDGFDGDYCEISENPCAPNPCHNGGTCELGESESSSRLSIIESRVRKREQTGDSPADDADRSSRSSRSSFGSSLSQIDYYCRCPPGYYGKNCDELEAPCASHPCQYGGTCHEDDNGHWCECPPGYAGTYCHIPIDPCNPNPCYNGGTCHNHGGGRFVCECQNGYHGVYCEIPPDLSHPCDSHPCQNGGTCYDDGEGGYYCSCREGYGGPYCEEEYHDHPPVGGYDCQLKNPCTPENIDNGDLYWPHEDPSKFVQCDLWGQCFVMDCPSGLIWNQEIWECVRP